MIQTFFYEPSQPSQEGQAATLSRPSVRDVPFSFQLNGEALMNTFKINYCVNKILLNES